MIVSSLRTAASALVVAALAFALLAATLGSALAHSALAFVSGGAFVALLVGAVVVRRAMFSAGFAAFACALAAAALAWSGLATGDLTSSAGLAVLGANADRLCALLVTAALVWLAVECAAARRAPLVPRLLATLLLLVVAISPAAALLSGAGISTALRTPAFGPLPAFANGAYLAVMALLPVAALASLGFAFASLSRRGGAAAARLGAGALALLAIAQAGAYQAGVADLPTVVAFEHPVISGALASGGASAANTTNATSVFATSPPAPAASSGSTSAPSVAATSAPEQPSAEAQAVAATTGASKMGEAFVPQGSGDVPAEVAAAFAGASDPQRALAAVAALGDELYPGALQGSAGALRSAGANSVDKALLLHDVLRARMPNVTTSFAQCTLSSDRADALIAQARAMPAHPKILMQLAAAESGGIANPKTRALAARWSQAWKTIVGQTRGESAKLAASLQTTGLTLPSGLPTQDALRALVAHHVWLRAQIGGDWVDLDPTIEPAAPGKTRCSPDAQTATLPDDLYDVLDVRIAAENQTNGALQRTDLLDRSVRTADIGDRQISFMFAEPTGMSPSTSAPAAGPMTFTPLLLVGEQSVAGTPIVLPPPSDASAGKAVGGAAQSAVSILSAGTASPSPAPTQALPAVTGVWMELSVASPGSATTQVEKPVFDRVGFAARVSQTAASPIPVQPDAATYRSMQTVWSVAVSDGDAVSGAGPSSVASDGDASAVGGALARLNGAYFALRRAIMDDAQGASVAVAATQPGISVVSLANGGALSSDVASDSTLPLTDRDARAMWAASSVLAERELLDGDVPVERVGAANDALGAFDVANALKSPWLGLRAGGTALPQSAAIPPEARARISAYLSRGASVLAPAPVEAQSGGPPYAFWIADPLIGTLRDEDEFGNHPELGEEAEETEEVAIKPISKWRAIGCRVAAAAMIWVTQDSSAAEGKTFEDAIESVEKAEEEESGCK